MMRSRSLRFRGFMRTVPCWLFAIFLLRAAVPIGLAGQDNPSTRASLEGLPGVGVKVHVSDAAQEAGYTESRLRTDAELRLRESGIRVLSRDEVIATDGYPDLRITLNAFDQDGLMVYSVDVELLQSVALRRQPSITLVEGVTWSVGSYGTVGQNRFREGMPSTIRSQVEYFINAFHSVNP